MLKDLIKLADHLDMIGEKDEASLLDEILPHIKNVAINMPEEFKDADTDANYMLPSQLSSISEKALIIKDMIKSGVSVDDWMETYIAQADLMIDNIYDKMVAHYSHDSEGLPCGCKEKCGCNA
jgi:hypothetical protein